MATGPRSRSSCDDESPGIRSPRPRTDPRSYQQRSRRCRLSSPSFAVARILAEGGGAGWSCAAHAEGWLPPIGGVVDVDLLAADGVGDLALFRARLLAEPDAFLGHDALLGDRLLLVQHDLVLFLGDLRAVHRVADVGVGDRLALDADLLALHRHGLRDGLRLDPLAQAGPAGLALLRADAQLLLGAR